MSIYKKLFGYFLILFSLSFIVMIGLPQFYSSNSSGRVDKEIDLEIDFLEDENSSIVLLYFGYVGCDTICVPSMTELNRIYTHLDNTKVKVYFVNLQHNDDKELPKLFAEHFNTNFIGVYQTKKDIQKLVNQIRVTFTTSLTNSGELDHSGYLYLLVKDTDRYKQKYIYTTRPFKEDSIIDDINLLLKENSK